MVASLAGSAGRYGRTAMPAAGTPAALRIDWISCDDSAAARSFAVPVGTSRTTPPGAPRAPPTREGEDIGALRRRETAAIGADEYLDGAAALLQDDRMPLPVIVGHDIDGLSRRVAAGERHGEENDRGRAADPAAPRARRPKWRTHCTRLLVTRHQSRMKPKLPL